MNLKLEKCTIADKDEVWELFLEAMKPHIEKIWGWEIDWQTNEFDERFFALNTSFLLLDDKKIGYVQFSLSEDDTYVNMLILYPEFRSKGLGIPVLKLIESFQHDKKLRLRCFKVNEQAYRFYLDNEFKVIAEEDNFYLLEWN